jgi:hypothetical protein
LELEFEGVDEGGAEEAEGEIEGRGVLADFGTDGDGRKGAVRLELYVVVDESSEGSDEMGAVVVKVLVAGDVLQEVAGGELFLGAPDLLTAVVDDGVLVGVALLFKEARRRSEEVREESEVHQEVFLEVGETGVGKSWLYLGGCSRYRGLGAGRWGWGRDTLDGGDDDGGRDVFDGDVLLVANGSVGGDRILGRVLELTDDQVLELVDCEVNEDVEGDRVVYR